MQFPGKVVRRPDNPRCWVSVACSCGAICLFLILYSSHLAAAPQASLRSAYLRTGQFPGVRFSSGLTVCDEELRNGRWVSRYWDSSGQIIADIQIDGE
jgi:hypothetical protein